jgi:DNA-3-methyladenine glycosylase
MSNKISREYYINNDVLWLARDLLGKYIFVDVDEFGVSGSIITETEAYRGPADRASHAFGNRRTRRTEVMFHQGGLSYVYLCYGIHHLFNIVTNTVDVPHAILIRAVKPVTGIENIGRRLNKNVPLLLNGPGVFSRATGIKTPHTALPLDGTQIWLEDHGLSISDKYISTGPRIGVDYAGEDALLPWRFFIPPPLALQILP